jgi:hypothetical protein
MVNYGSKICVGADSDNTGLPALLSKKLIEDERDVQFDFITKVNAMNLQKCADVWIELSFAPI